MPMNAKTPEILSGAVYRSYTKAWPEQMLLQIHAHLHVLGLRDLVTEFDCILRLASRSNRQAMTPRLLLKSFSVGGVIWAISSIVTFSLAPKGSWAESRQNTSRL